SWPGRTQQRMPQLHFCGNVISHFSGTTQTMNRPIIIKLLSGLINILTCLIAVTIVLFRQDWFGKGDTYAFVFWTVPLAVALAISGKTILTIYRTTIFLLRLLLIIFTAGILSFGWAYCVALVLGPWI